MTGPESIATLVLTTTQTYSNPYIDPLPDSGLALDRDPDTNSCLTLTPTVNPTSIRP